MEDLVILNLERCWAGYRGLNLPTRRYISGLFTVKASSSEEIDGKDVRFSWAASGDFKSFHCSNRVFGMLRPGMLCRGRVRRYGGRIEHAAHRLVGCIISMWVAKIFLTFCQFSSPRKAVRYRQLFQLASFAKRIDALKTRRRHRLRENSERHNGGNAAARNCRRN